VALSARPDMLSYGRMRGQWCRLALLSFARRWAAYIVVAGAVVGAGTTGFAHILMAAAAWLVLPLFYAAGHGAWLVPAVLAQAALGAAAVWGMRQLLWPTAWAQAERALPIAPSATWRSDAWVVLIALSPLLVMLAVGAAALLGQNPAWLRDTRGLAVAALLLASALSLVLGVLLLQRLRQPPRAFAMPSFKVGRLARVQNKLAWTWVLLWLPLWRGPARRTGQMLLAGGLLLCVPACGIAATGTGMGWWLAAWALLALVVATRINQLACEELQPLLQACAPLPLAAAPLQRLRASLALWPVLWSLCWVCAALARAPLLRPGVLAAFVLVVLGSCAWEVFSAPAQPDVKAGRWLFSLALCVALATEVMA
jgi:hypothetical protein